MVIDDCEYQKSNRLVMVYVMPDGQKYHLVYNGSEDAERTELWEAIATQSRGIAAIAATQNLFRTGFTHKRETETRGERDGEERVRSKVGRSWSTGSLSLYAKHSGPWALVRLQT